MGKNLREIMPEAGVMDFLNGVVSEPIQTVSKKPGEVGKLVDVRIALEGPCLWGLTDYKDNKEWSGIINHMFLTERYAINFGILLSEAGVKVKEHDIKTMFEAMGNHPGRRQSDEAYWYPYIVSEKDKKIAITNEVLGLDLIRGKVSDDAFELIAALAHDNNKYPVDIAVYDRWAYKLTSYVDHRTTDKYQPLAPRMAGFIFTNYFDQENLTPGEKNELREIIQNAITGIFLRRKNFNLGLPNIKNVSLEEADRTLEDLGAKSYSKRGRRDLLIGLVLEGADTESELIKAGINPDNINNQTVPMPKWESQLRYKYVEAAKENSLYFPSVFF